MDKVIEPQKIPEILEIRHVEMFANFIRTYNANKSSKIDLETALLLSYARHWNQGIQKDTTNKKSFEAIDNEKTFLSRIVNSMHDIVKS